jgi:hypothetical protein
MPMAPQAAAWVAWAAWTCNIHPLQAKPASAGYNQSERASARSLFLGTLVPHTQRAVLHPVGVLPKNNRRPTRVRWSSTRDTAMTGVLWNELNDTIAHSGAECV